MSVQEAKQLISVITPSLNCARYLGEAIESVRAQGYSNVEHIVADGGSTDGTAELLQHYPDIRLIRGPDGGLYDGLNKGLAAARGQIIGILNADDLYAEGAFAAANRVLTGERVMAAGGDAVSFEDSEQPPRPEASLRSIADDALFGATLGNPAMNAWFFRPAVFATIGSFDAGFEVAGDREFMLRLACSGLLCANIPKLVYRYRIHPGSMTFAGNARLWKTIAREHSKIARDYLRMRGLPKRAYSLIREASSRDTLRLAIRSARSRDWRQFCSQSVQGIRHDPWWPLRLAKRAMLSSASTKAARPKER
jgi:glycosyltransferase involved in cell wall biosynthesis